MEEVLLTAQNLKAIVGSLIASAQHQVVAPVSGKPGFEPLTDPEQVVLNSDLPPTLLSIKQFFFPRTEPLFFYQKKTTDIELVAIKPEEVTTVILGAKPCDAAAPGILDAVFNWDFHDDLFNHRRAQTIIIGMACTYKDQYCYCTSVGLSPTSMTGSDLFLIPLDAQTFALRILTEKGATFIEPYRQYLGEAEPDKAQQVLDAIVGPEPVCDADKIRGWLDNNFEHNYWDTLGQNCLGCGRCTFVCPTCHCFDIIDEEMSYNQGRRMKNWDACQFALFTKHASGHNPREGQTKRYRQRVMHKFKYYPDKFEQILCTGCGRCSRGCPVGIDLSEILAHLTTLA